MTRCVISALRRMKTKDNFTLSKPSHFLVTLLRSFNVVHFHLELLSAQYLAGALQPDHPAHRIVNPSPSPRSLRPLSRTSSCEWHRPSRLIQIYDRLHPHQSRSRGNKGKVESTECWELRLHPSRQQNHLSLGRPVLCSGS